MTDQSSEQHLDHIVDVLDDKHEDLDPATIRREAAGIYRDLCSTSKVENFVPILALRQADARLEALEAERLDEQTEVAGFVEKGDAPRWAPGDIVSLVDGRFRITRCEPTEAGTRYHGHWVDEA